MPLVAHTSLPTFERLRGEGEEILALDRAQHQDIRELHVGFLNIMPDAAFEATERQFLRLVGSCNQIVQFYVHPFTLDGIERGETTSAHVAAHYRRFEQVADEGIDALIVTGANMPEGPFAGAPFWRELTEVFDFAQRHVTSTLCACLATHAALAHFHGIERLRLPRKRWGVFPHRPSGPPHPLTRIVNTRFDVPHSRYHDIDRGTMEDAGVRVLADSEIAGVHLAVSRDLLRFVYFQGHPEYDRQSLLKEYKREIVRYARGERDDYPPRPERYFSREGRLIAQQFEARVAELGRGERVLAEFPEEGLSETVDNTWGDTARTVFNNWLGEVYQHTGFGRHEPFLPEVDPEDPLGLHGAQL